MSTEQKINNFKKELLLLRINKITKQKTEVRKMKKIQDKISRINQLNNKK
uniref:Ribosomal protein L29 n=1 Tax=Polysiphonia infestans TaxID=2006978 RepID=A0A1Z1MEA8_9FLOR|nr:ribosomal protein L29 [Polysiphonia infestans]ARW64407.1 ribosomal protein L29 [Polysiphonia infestans]